ncbi:MAG: YhcG family protein [Rickettsia slovaca]|uniref:Uncharacterized protein n=1 Tax=Rickettsia slovaca str. D-CWPP TaxID=1105109 RepID=H8LP77_RICSL|nr:YhcG family protein [Rickettsia slovaca]AFD19383.1 hypothetical protein MC3_02095 [Rickettsia slovaca str. D-CWPP]
MSNTLSNESYTNLIKNLKQEISKARIRAHLAANKELIVPLLAYRKINFRTSE